MDLIEKACVMDAARVNRALSRLGSEIVERNRGAEGLVLVGIRRRGVPVAERIAERIGDLERAKPVVGALDISFYADDLSLVAPKPLVREAPLPESLDGVTVVLVDDVLYTGRTIYAAIDFLLNQCRPQ